MTMLYSLALPAVTEILHYALIQSITGSAYMNNVG